jgi:hypothetical protein
MKHALTALAILASATLCAQRQPDPAPSVVDLHLAGYHLETAGKMRGQSLAALAVGGLVAGGLYWNPSTKRTDAPFVAICFGAAVSVGFTIGAATHEIKAGKLLRGH